MTAPGTTITTLEARATQLARWINVLALFALIGVLAGSLHLQFGIGEQPCPLCLVQRSAMIGLAIGPLMNLLWGMKPAHYAPRSFGDEEEDALVEGAPAAPLDDGTTAGDAPVVVTATE